MGDRQCLKGLLKTGLLLLCLTGIGITGSEVKADEGEVQIIREASGDLESLIAIEISEESMSELEEWSAANSTQYAQNSVSSAANQFLEYGSDYGYQDMLKRSNSTGRQDAYQKMKELSKTFSVNGQDAGQITLDGTVYTVAGTVDLARYNLTKDEKVEAYYTFRHDNPQFFWLSNTILYSNNQLTVLTYDAYKTGTVRQAALEEIVNTAETVYKSQISSDDTSYEKVKKIHDTLIEDIDYSNDTEIPTAHSIAGAMTSTKSAVCEGYAKVMQVMMNSYDITNIYVTGIGYNSSGNGGAHAWNMVRMNDGKYYWLDATWDDPIGGNLRWRYFLVGNQNFIDHTVDLSTNTGTGFLYELPQASDVDYDPANPPVDPPVDPVTPFSKGDINGDGVIDLFDLMQCLSHVAGRITLEGDAFNAANVVDTDNVVDLFDLMKILNHIAKGSAL